MDKISNLDQFLALMEKNGYEAEQQEESVLVKLGNPEAPFLGIVTINDEVLSVNCQVATLREIKDDAAAMAQFGMACLDANTRIAPYAYALVTGKDDETLKDEEDFLVVLFDTVPVGDLSEGEALIAIESLGVALVSVPETLAEYLEEVKEPVESEA